MSASFLLEGPAGVSGRGFTLLELLVVLALVSMLAAMVAPRLQGTYDAVARSGDRADAIRQLEGLPLRARDSGRAIDIPANDAAAFAPYLKLPGGWSARALQPFRVEASGLCHGGKVRVDGDGGETWTLSAPDCTVLDAP